MVSLVVIGAEASACMGSQYHMLSDVTPQSTQGGEFIGYVKVHTEPSVLPVDFDASNIALLRADGIPPNKAVELEILESVSHPRLVGQILRVEYLSTSCGPTLKQAQSGFVVGDFKAHSSDGLALAFAPHDRSTKD